MKPICSKIIMTLLFFALTAAFGDAQEADNFPKPAPGEILVASGSPLEVPYAPVSLLIAALKSNPKANRFRVTWSYNAFHYSSDEAAIYDRSAGHLALFSASNKNDHNHLVFTGVKEGMFAKILARHKNDYEGNGWGYFDDLTKYGCHKYDLTAPHKVRHQPGRRRRASMATSSRRTLAANLVTAA